MKRMPGHGIMREVQAREVRVKEAGCGGRGSGWVAKRGEEGDGMCSGLRRFALAALRGTDRDVLF